MNQPMLQREFVLRRLAESWHLGDRELSGTIWLAVVIPLLVVGLIYAAWMYRRDCRTIAWPIAVGLGLFVCWNFKFITFYLC